MSDKNYGPTTTPGQIRHNCRYIGIELPADERTDAEKASGVATHAPIISYLEREMIRLANGQGERKLKDLDGDTISLDDMGLQIPQRDHNDNLTGESVPVQVTFQQVYSFIRYLQENRLASSEEILAPQND